MTTLDHIVTISTLQWAIELSDKRDKAEELANKEPAPGDSAKGAKLFQVSCDNCQCPDLRAAD